MDFDVKLKVDIDWIEVGLTWYKLDGVNVKLNVKICSDAWRSCCIFKWRYDVGIWSQVLYFSTHSEILDLIGVATSRPRNPMWKGKKKNATKPRNQHEKERKEEKNR